MILITIAILLGIITFLILFLPTKVTKLEPEDRIIPALILTGVLLLINIYSSK